MTALTASGSRLEARKRAQGQFYTRGNPFTLLPFRQWAETVGLSRVNLLEPFAGANDIIHSLREIGLCDGFTSYDISPADRYVIQRDTIRDFPKNFYACVTNPPWLARNSATRRGLPFPSNRYDNLYKHCLQLCLDNCRYVAALIPASYLQSGLFRKRLKTYILLHDTIFADTENPVCLALFDDAPSEQVEIYYDDRRVGTLGSLIERLPRRRTNRNVRFNDPQGALGFISFDDTKRPSIRFCEAEEVKEYDIKVSSRFITRISGDFNNLSIFIESLNNKLDEFRRDTCDIFLTPYNGLRDDGQYRRRMQFGLARELINAV